MKTEEEIKYEMERLENHLSVFERSVEKLNIKLDNFNKEPYRGFEDGLRKQHEIQAIISVKSSILMDMYNIEAKLDILHYVLGLEPYKYKHQ